MAVPQVAEVEQLLEVAVPQSVELTKMAAVRLTPLVGSSAAVAEVLQVKESKVC